MLRLTELPAIRTPWGRAVWYTPAFNGECGNAFLHLESLNHHSRMAGALGTIEKNYDATYSAHAYKGEEGRSYLADAITVNEKSFSTVGDALLTMLTLLREGNDFSSIELIAYVDKLFIIEDEGANRERA